MRLDLPPDYRGGFWTVLVGVGAARIHFTGDWRPTYYAVWPDRAFRLQDYGVKATTIP